MSPILEAGPARLPASTNHPPVADAGGPYATVEGGTSPLSATATDPDGDALSCAWDLDGDGAFDDASGPTPTATFLAEGTTAIALEVTDGQGGVADFATVLEEEIAPSTSSPTTTTPPPSTPSRSSRSPSLKAALPSSAPAARSR